MTRAHVFGLSAALLLGGGAFALSSLLPHRTSSNHHTARIAESPSPPDTARATSPVPTRAPAPSSSVAARGDGENMPHAPAPSDDAAGVLVETAQALPDDRVAEKRALLRRALDLDPRRVDALLALGEIRLDDEDYAEAIDLARRCLDVDKGNDDCADVRRMALGRSGRQDPEDTELAYAQNRHDFGRVQGLAQLRISQGRLVEARALIEEMRALAPESSLVPTMEGDVALSSGDPAGARQAFEAACHLGQEHACIEAERLRSPR